MRIKIEDAVKEFIRELPEKDRRVIGEHIERLSDHPNAMGISRKLRYPQTPLAYAHITENNLVLLNIVSDTVWIDNIMTTEQAHKK